MSNRKRLLEDIKATGKCSAGCIGIHATLLLMAVAVLESLVT
jgi:hypothetical protein